MSPVPPYCDRLRSHFDDFHDGETSFFLHNVIERHLSACPSCREDYQRLLRAIEAVRVCPAPDAPARLLRNVIEAHSGPPGGALCPRELQGPDLVEGMETP